MTNRMTPVLAALVAGLSFVATPAAAQEAPPMYVWVGIGTTAVYVPPAGQASGPLGDVSPTLAIGYMVTPTVSLELDLGMTFTPDGYAASGLGPAVIWSFSSSFYAAGRLYVPVDPDLNLVVMPGIAWYHTYGEHISPFVELDLASTIGRGEPDLGLLASAGVTYYF